MRRDFAAGYLESIRKSMDEEPVLALALSLGRAEALNDPKVDAVRQFVRQAEDPDGDVASLAAADRIVRGEEAALNGTEFYNLMVNIRSLDGVGVLGSPATTPWKSSTASGTPCPALPGA